MPNFEEMYYTMVRASEAAIKIIIEAQQKCEEMYISQPEQQVEHKDQPEM